MPWPDSRVGPIVLIGGNPEVILLKATSRGASWSLMG